MKNLFPAILLALAVASVFVPAQAAEPKKLLVVTTTTGFRHTSIPTLEKVIGQLARLSGAFTVDHVRQPEGKPNEPGRQATEAERIAYREANAKWIETQLAPALEKLSPAALKNYAGVVFASTTGDLPIPDREGFLRWIRDGGAFIGIHSASDTLHAWPEYREMLGGEFDHHGAQVGVECVNCDAAHPANAGLGKTWPIAQEEVYLFKNYDAGGVRELLVLDKHPNEGTPGRCPVSWCRDYGSGRVFYTSLGHREDLIDADPGLPDRKNPIETSTAYQAHLLGGIEWALGLKASPPAESR